MKNLIKVLLLSFLVSQSMLSHAGNYTWKLKANVAAGVSDDAAKAAIHRGFQSADKNLPDLAKPWIVGIEVHGGSTTSESKPGYIFITKEKDAGASGVTIKCRSIRYGTFSNGEVLNKLETEVGEFAAFLETSKCK